MAWPVLPMAQDPHHLLDWLADECEGRACLVAGGAACVMRVWAPERGGYEAGAARLQARRAEYRRLLRAALGLA